MTIPFSRSIRILDADKFRPSLLIIGLALVVLVSWLLWFFLARVTLLETGKIVNISSTGEVQTEFVGQTAQRIRVGQPGWLRLDGKASDTLGLVPVIVVRRYALVDEATRVDMVILDERFFTILLEDAPSGSVQVEVERISPATLLLRSSGQFAGAPRVSTSPQSGSNR